MAAEIDMSNGRANVAFAGQKLWHNLGTQLTKNSPLAIWEREAGFNWEILQGDVSTVRNDGTTINMPERQLLYRSDTLAPLSVVSHKYKVVQPREILAFYEDLIESAGFTMETAGMLFGGRRFWALANTNNSGQVVPGDDIDQYLLLTTACDGSLATTAKFTSVRVACNNMLSMALSAGGTRSIKVPHNANFDPQVVKKALGVATGTWDLFMGNMRALAAKKMTNNEAVSFLVNIVGDPYETLEDQSAGAAALMQSIYSLWNGNAMGYELVGKTRWGMLNAVSEYYDHHTGHKTRDAAVNNTWYGEGEKIKQKAESLLLAA